MKVMSDASKEECFLNIREDSFMGRGKFLNHHNLQSINNKLTHIPHLQKQSGAYARGPQNLKHKYVQRVGGGTRVPSMGMRKTMEEGEGCQCSHCSL